MHKFKLWISGLLIFTVVISLLIPCFAEETTYVWSTLPTNANLDTNVSNNSEEKSTSNTLNLESESAILIEQTTRANIV